MVEMGQNKGQTFHILFMTSVSVLLSLVYDLVLDCFTSVMVCQPVYLIQANWTLQYIKLIFNQAKQ